MTLYEMPNMSGGADNLLINLITAVPSFAPMMLMFTYLIVFLGGMTAQRNRTGITDAPLWNMFGALSIFLLSTAMTITAGIISLEIYSIVIAVNILGAIWLFLSQNRNEV